MQNFVHVQQLTGKRRTVGPSPELKWRFGMCAFKIGPAVTGARLWHIQAGMNWFGRSNQKENFLEIQHPKFSRKWITHMLKFRNQQNIVLLPERGIQTGFCPYAM